MKKILLIGKPGDIIRSISDYLDSRFKLQICFDQPDMVMDMLKVFRPDMLVYCHGSGEPAKEDLFNLLKESKKSVLIVSTKEEWNKLEKYFTEERFHSILRPMQTSQIAAKCSAILNLPGSHDITDDEGTESPHPSHKRIMVVDDSSLVLRNVKSILEPDYLVSVAPSGEKALSQLSRSQPDLILLDYEMPGMTGKEVYDAILDMPEFSKIPVIFLTSVSDPQKVMEILQKNPAGYILKPITTNTLIEKIKTVLANV